MVDSEAAGAVKGTLRDSLRSVPRSGPGPVPWPPWLIPRLHALAPPPADLRTRARD